MMTSFMRMSQKFVFHKSKCICAIKCILSTTAMYVSSSSFMYLSIPCYCDACLNSSALRVGVTTLLNTIHAYYIESVLPPGMGAYRSHRETWINPAMVEANIWDGFEERDNTLLVALDLEDVYNRVWLPILADRMLQLGISVFWVRRVISALNTRRCMIKHRTWRSDWIPTSTGLPQGSSLSPVLLNIYTLPLARLNQPHCRLRTFVDDILVSCRGISAQDMIDLISPNLHNIEANYECSGMYCSGEKAEAMLCTLNNRLQPSSFPPIRYDGQEIRVSDILCHLRVIFDRQLNFSEHVSSVLHRGIKAANILKVAAGRKAEERHLVMLYKSLSSLLSTTLCL